MILILILSMSLYFWKYFWSKDTPNILEPWLILLQVFSHLSKCTAKWRTKIQVGPKLFRIFSPFEAHDVFILSAVYEMTQTPVKNKLIEISQFEVCQIRWTKWNILENVILIEIQQVWKYIYCIICGRFCHSQDLIL